MVEKMTDTLSSLDARVEQLAARVEALTLKVDALSIKLDGYSAIPVKAGAAPQDDQLPDASEALLSWVGRSSLLQRLSTI